MRKRKNKLEKNAFFKNSAIIHATRNNEVEERDKVREKVCNNNNFDDNCDNKDNDNQKMIKLTNIKEHRRKLR